MASQIELSASAKRASVLVQQDCGGALGAGLGQTNKSGRRHGIGMPTIHPLAPRREVAARGHERLLDHRHGSHPTMTVQFDGIVCTPTEYDLLTLFAAKTSDHELINGIRHQRPATGRIKQPFDGSRRPQSFDSQRSNRPATRRC